MSEFDVFSFSKTIETEFSKLSKSVESLNSLLDLVNLFRWIGYGMLLLSFVDIVDMFIPLKIMNSDWEFQTMGKLVNQAAIPLVGLLFVFLGKLEKRAKWEKFFLASLSRLTLLVAVLYILLIPLGISSTLRLYSNNMDNFNTEYNKFLSQTNQTETQLKQATPADLENLINRQGPKVEIKNPEELKKRLLSDLAQAREKAKQQIDANKSSSNLILFKSSIKWNLGALVSAVLFLIIWRGTPWARKKMTF